MEYKKLALSFNGGGASALSYLGFLRGLEDSGIKVDILQGFSGGAIVFCFMASGMSDPEIIREFAKFRFYKLYSWNPIGSGGLLTFEKTKRALSKYTKGMKIEELPYKTYIHVSDVTDYEDPKSVLYTNGNLAKIAAISCIVPPFWPLYEEDGKKYADGGYTTLYGTKDLREKGADVIIGLSTDAIVFTKAPKIVSGLVSVIESALTQVDDHERMIESPDFEIRNFGIQVSLGDFPKAEEMYKAGWKKAKEVLPQIKKLLG